MYNCLVSDGSLLWCACTEAAGCFLRKWKVLVGRKQQHQREEFVFPLLCLWCNASAISLESVRLSYSVVCITKDLIEWYFKQAIANCFIFQIATLNLRETWQEIWLGKNTAGELRKYLLDGTELHLELGDAHSVVSVKVPHSNFGVNWETWLPYPGQGQGVG